MPRETSAPTPPAPEKGAVVRGMRAALPAIAATAVLLVLDTAVRGLAGGAPSVAAALLSGPATVLLVFLLPAALVALAVVAFLATMQRRAPTARTASLLVGLSTLAWIGTANRTLVGLLYAAVIAIGGALIGWIMSQPWPRTRRIVASLGIAAGALVVLGFGS